MSGLYLFLRSDGSQHKASRTSRTHVFSDRGGQFNMQVKKEVLRERTRHS